MVVFIYKYCTQIRQATACKDACSNISVYKLHHILMNVILQTFRIWLQILLEIPMRHKDSERKENFPNLKSRGL